MTDDKELVKREVCPKCGGHKFVLNHYLRERHHDRIYLECADCGEFTARIIVHAYIDPHTSDPNKYKHFLKNIGSSDNISARKTLDDYEVHSERAIGQFKKVKEIIETNKKNKSEEKRKICELISEYRIREDYE